MLSLVACDRIPFAAAGIRRGTALEPPASRWGYNLDRRFGVRDGFRFVFFSLQNVSDTSVRLHDIRPYGVEGSPETAKLSWQITLRTNERPGLPWGRYVTYPLVWKHTDGTCRFTQSEPIEGQILQPSKTKDGVTSPDAVTVLRVKAIGPGAVSLKGYRIKYEQHGDMFVQDFPLKISFKVSKSGPLLPGTEEEKTCTRERVEASFEPHVGGARGS